MQQICPGDEIKTEHLIKNISSHVDIFIENQSIIIQVDGPRHFNEKAPNTFTQNIFTKFNTKLLEDSGYQVIRVAFFEWNASADKESYIRELLNNAGYQKNCSEPRTVDSLGKDIDVLNEFIKLLKTLDIKLTDTVQKQVKQLTINFAKHDSEVTIADKKLLQDARQCAIKLSTLAIKSEIPPDKITPAFLDACEKIARIWDNAKFKEFREQVKLRLIRLDLEDLELNVPDKQTVKELLEDTTRSTATKCQELTRIVNEYFLDTMGDIFYDAISGPINL